MKLTKLLTLFTAILLVQTCFAQEKENNMKNFRFGLKVTPMLAWFRPDGTKVIESDGVKAKFGYGLMTEFRLNKNISFATGIGADYEGGKLNYKDSAVYYALDNNILDIKEDTAGKKYAIYLLNNREFNVSYLNIPITLKMKTGDIGGITYYGLFGGDLGIRLKAKATDKKTDLQVPSGFNYDTENINITKDMNILRICLNVGAGLEYNLAGTTSLVVGVNYRRGFLSAPKSTSDQLRKGKTKTSFSQPAPGDAFLLTVGVLF
ncbi:MAG: outer membrane beta-barrel protein [Bacteroidetes bacterium]|nr:outer membrane beta-barrel protein [Bacteroidota bacterium]